MDMVSAWASENELVFDQVKVDDKSNELTAIPELLRKLGIAGCIVTVDSMGWEVDVAKTCVEQEADDVLAHKENQPLQYADVERLFADLDNQPAQKLYLRLRQPVNCGHAENAKPFQHAHPI